MGPRNKFSVAGSIKRITMKNFMTYNHETIFPGDCMKTTMY